MNITLNNDVTAAAKALRGNPDWEKFRKGLGDVSDSMTDKAIGSDPALRIESTAFARALRDLWVQLEAATNDVPPRTVQKRSTVGKSKPAHGADILEGLTSDV
jgi:hypothetical protein